MKKLFSLLIGLLTILWCLLPIQAKNSSISSISIDCFIDSSGTATITEVWDAQLYKNQHIEKIFYNLEDNTLKINNITNQDGYSYILDNSNSLTDLKHVYTYTQTNTGAYTYLELQKDKGHHIYTINYSIEHFINQYDDTQGFQYRFFEQGNIPVKKIDIDIYSDSISFEKNTSHIYPFGYSGTCDFDHGHISLTCHNKPKKIDLLCQITTMMSPFSSPSITYQDVRFDNILSDLKGDDSTSIPRIIRYLIIGFVIILAITIPIIIRSFKKYQNRRPSRKMIFDDQKPFMKKYCKPISHISDYDILYFYYLSKKCNLLTNKHHFLINAFIEKWNNEGTITKEDKQIIFDNQSIVSSSIEEELLMMFKEASHHQRILDEQRLELWCVRHISKLQKWYSTIPDFIEQQLKESEDLTIETTYTKILGLDLPHTQNIYSSKIRKDLEQVYGFYLYLKENHSYTTLDQKIYAIILGLDETVLWMNNILSHILEK